LFECCLEGIRASILGVAAVGDLHIVELRDRAADHRPTSAAANLGEDDCIAGRAGAGSPRSRNSRRNCGRLAKEFSTPKFWCLFAHDFTPFAISFRRAIQSEVTDFLQSQPGTPTPLKGSCPCFIAAYLTLKQRFCRTPLDVRR